MLLSAVVYHTVTGAYFFADDLLFLVRLADQPLREVLLDPFGGHLLLVRNAVFAAMYRLFGANPAPFYWSLFLTYLLNVWLLFRLLRVLTASPAIGCLGAALWGTCPVHVAVVGWYAGYGQVLATTALLLVLIGLARADVGEAPSPARVLSWSGIVLVGAMCFGTGIGVALVFPAVAALLCPRAARRPAALAALLGLPLAVAGLYQWVSTRGAAAPRTAMQYAIVSRAADAIPVMLGHLLAYATAALVLGFFFVPAAHPHVSEIYPGRISHTAVLALGTLLAGGFWLADGKRRRELLAAGILAAGIYGIIALGRAGLAAGNLTFQAGQPRYHYAGTVPIAVLLCLAVDQLRRRVLARVPWAELLLIVWLVAGAIGFARSGWRPDSRARVRQWFEATRRQLEAEIDRAPPGATLHLENGEVPSVIRGPAILSYDVPGRAALFVMQYPSDVVRGRRVRFVEPNRQTREWHARRGGRLGQLLVAPGAVVRAAPGTP